MVRLLRSSIAPDPSIAAVAATIGDRTRAAMLCALLDGNELSAGELAHRAGVAANAASAHLAKLVSAGLIVARNAGRQRFFHLAGADVGRALEALSVIAPPVKIVALSQARISEDLRAARSCYDHLAGRLGVAVTQALVERGIIVPKRDDSYAVPGGSVSFFASAGIDVESARCSRRHFARQCMDWSERRPHLAGSLGAAVCNAFLKRAWVKTNSSSRALRVTPAGLAWLRSELAIELPEAGR